jgi:hypothetical protein
MFEREYFFNEMRTIRTHEFGYGLIYIHFTSISVAENTVSEVVISYVLRLISSIQSSARIICRENILQQAKCRGRAKKSGFPQY